jgi:hypothetical protein
MEIFLKILSISIIGIVPKATGRGILVFSNPVSVAHRKLIIIHTAAAHRLWSYAEVLQILKKSINSIYEEK